tara:strand:+ start:488 stop:1303 length:816 start_codon:yes stop_codon:yes gene_type:complete
MGNNMSAYEILSVTEESTNKEIKEQYIKMCKVYHPDKGGNSEIFNAINKAFHTIMTERTNKQSERINRDVVNREYQDLPKKFQNVHISKDNFNNKKFNNVFRDYKIESAYDKGYGNEMTDSKKTRESINIERLQSMDKRTFKNQFQKKCTKVIEYKDPEPVYSNNKSNYVELGVTDINDFTGRGFTDYKRAYSEDFFDSTKMQRDSFKSVNEYRSARETQNMRITPEEQQRLQIIEEQKQQNEQERLRRVREYDKLYEQQFNKLNKVFIKE